MTKLIIFLSLILSFNTYAFEDFNLSALTSISPLITTDQKQVANVAMNDVAEFHNSGLMSLKLAQDVANLQQTEDLSVEEAVDLISANALEILN